MKTLRALVLAALLAVLSVRAVPVASALGARSLLSARTAFDVSGGRAAEARRAVPAATAVPVSGGLGRLASTSNLGRRAGLAPHMSSPYVSRSELDRTSAKLHSPAKHQVSWRGYDSAPTSTTSLEFVATKPDLTDDKGRKHILDGDETGGGHRAGTGKSGKSEFPADWSDEKILGEISDVATDPRSKTSQGGKVSEGARGGVDIKVVVGGGRIKTGYPTNRPRNP